MTNDQHSTTGPDLRPVTRVINLIQIARGLLMFVIAAVTLMAVFSAPGSLFSVMVLLYGAIAALGTYVLFGWFEHTLGLLAGIYRNTYR